MKHNVGRRLWIYLWTLIFICDIQSSTHSYMNDSWNNTDWQNSPSPSISKLLFAFFVNITGDIDNFLQILIRQIKQKLSKSEQNSSYFW